MSAEKFFSSVSGTKKSSCVFISKKAFDSFGAAGFIIPVGSHFEVVGLGVSVWPCVFKSDDFLKIL